MKKIYLLGLILLLAGAGCTAKAKTETTVSTLSTYQLEIVKSPHNINSLKINSSKNNLNLEELLNLSQIKFTKEQAGQKENITSLDGVISTISRQWNFYLNDQKIDLNKLADINLKPENKIQWKYETI